MGRVARGLHRRLLHFLTYTDDGGPRRPRARRFLAGFSQGAELTALVSAENTSLAGTVILSGPPSRSVLHGRVFIAHGSADAIIQFSGAEAAARAHAATAEVTWVPFDGGHSTRPARAELAPWLRGCFSE